MTSKNVHHLTGKQGEALASGFLKQKGFTILHCNWRYSRYEIDIIAEKGGVLHFIEVKTRRTDTFGLPEESVSVKKLKHLMRAAAAYQYQFPGWKRIQLDILSITLTGDQPPAFFFIEDAYL